jgi:hypothetical protein
MQRLLASLFVVGLSAVLAAQSTLRSTNRLEFQSGAVLEISYRPIDFGSGATLGNLMSKEERGAGMRSMFNERGFKSQIAGKLTVATPTEIAGNEVEAGAYNLSFRIDDDLVWYLVVLTAADEEIFAAALDVEENEDAAPSRLSIRPLASNNDEATGSLEIRFGKLAAAVEFKAGEKD